MTAPPYPGPTKVLSANYLVSGSQFAIADEDGDALEPEDIWRLARAVEDHTHDDDRGLPVRRLDAVSAPTAPGHVQLAGDDLRWWAGTAGVPYTAVNADADQAISGFKRFNAPLLLPGQIATPPAPGVGLTYLYTKPDGLLYQRSGDGPETPVPDPVVLTPYALTDGTRPFTGPVSFQSTVEVVGAAAFDSGVTIDTILGVGIAPPPWVSDLGVVQAGIGALYGGKASNLAGIRVNSSHDGVSNYALITGPAVDMSLASGLFRVFTAPQVNAGQNQDFTERFSVSTLGGVTITQDATVPALTWGGGGQLTLNGANPMLRTTNAGTNLELDPTGGYIHPPVDGFHNVGAPAKKFSTMYAANGMVQTSDPAMKQGAFPVKPDDALADALAVTILEYDLPAPTPDDPGATMHHVGFAADQATPARLSMRRRGRSGVTTSLGVEANTTASTALGAVQALAAHLAALTARVAALEAR